MVQPGVVQPGGQIRDQRDRQYLRTEVPRGDRLERGGHADEVGTGGAQHPDLGRRLVMRAWQCRVDTLVEAGIGLPGQGAQPGRVQLRKVGEPRSVAGRRLGSGQRGPAGEVQVVADQHGLTDRETGLDAAGSVGQHDDPAAGRDRGPHPVHHGVDRVSLVQVRPAEEDQYPGLADQQRSGHGRVAGHGRLREAAEFEQRELGRRRAQGVSRGCPAGAEYHGRVVRGLAGQQSQVRRAGLCG